MHSWVCAATVVTPKKNDSKVQAVSSHSSVHQPYADHAAVLPRPSADLVEPCSQIASVVYGPQLHAVDLPLAQKQNLISLWNSLYLGYLVRQGGSELFERSGNSKQTIDQYWQDLKNPSSQLSTNPFCMYTALKQDPIEIAASKICIDTSSLQTQPIDIGHCRQNLENMYQACSQYQNVLKDLQAYLASVSDSSWSDVQKNYVTQHMQKAVARMAATCSIQKKGLSCTPQFTGDIRDMGIIVNIQNNTDTTYALIQTSTDGKQAAQIGTLAPGLNNVNLHTAAMIPVTSTAKNKQSAAYHFDIVPMGSASTGQDLFSVKMMSGKELVTLLRSVSNNKKDIFVMNGRQVAKKYAVDEKLDFLVIVQIPKNPTAVVDGIPVGQRIQAFCVSPFKNQMLLTMQINQQEITLQSHEQVQSDDAQDESVDTATAQKQMVQQPSFFSSQEIDIFKERSNLPMIILPSFLVKNSTVNLYWILLQTIQVATQTDFSFFDEKCFAKNLSYFNFLGFFDLQQQCRIVLNSHPIYMTPSMVKFKMISNVQESVTFETHMFTCRDIPILYIDQSENGSMVANDRHSLYFNLNIHCAPVLNEKIIDISDHGSLGTLYGVPFKNDLICCVSAEVLKAGVFVTVKKITETSYEFVFADKKNELFSKVLYFDQRLQYIQNDFLDGNQFWVGSLVASDMFNQTSSMYCSYKLNVVYDNQTRQNKLLSSMVTPIDKIDVVRTINFFEYPLRDLYIDLYRSYQLSEVYHCPVINNASKPGFLQILTQQDWENGVYLVLNIDPKEHCSATEPCSLRVTFYQSDQKTILGSLHIAGKADQSDVSVGISDEIKAYNIGGSSFVTHFDLPLDTAVLLKYKKN